MTAGIRFTSTRIVNVDDLKWPVVRGTILSVLNRYAAMIKKDFEATTATWKDHHPVFTVTRRFAGGEILLSVTTDDRVWGMLNRGTSSRWALMSHDFLPKTAVRQLTSYPGAGRVMYRGKAEMMRAGIAWAQPGIEAREWTVVVADLYRNELKRDLKISLRTALNKALARGTM